MYEEKNTMSKVCVGYFKYLCGQWLMSERCRHHIEINSFTLITTIIRVFVAIIKYKERITKPS